MAKPSYETLYESSQLGIRLSFLTTPGGYNPLHWHNELEILYHLNGEADITVEGKKYSLPKKNLLTVESCQVHSTHVYDMTGMYLCIHVSKNHLKNYLPEIELYQIRCYPQEISDEDFPAYLHICELLAEITKLYMTDAAAYRLEAEGLVIQAVSRLIRYFSSKALPEKSDVDTLTIERIRRVITYVREHYKEPISLQDISGLLGLSREYFCRFFKKNMKISFLEYLNDVRLSHIYEELQETDTPIGILIEENGFTNQKLFNRSFKKLYGCRPSEVRAMKCSQQDT